MTYSSLMTLAIWFLGAVVGEYLQDVDGQDDENEDENENNQILPR